MKLSEKLTQTRDWLVDQRSHLVRGWKNPEHFDAQLADLTMAIVEAKAQEAALHSSWEFFTNQWEPDDSDRASFVTELGELIEEEDPNE